MDDPVYRTLKMLAIGLGLLWLGWMVYEGLAREHVPGEKAYEAASRHFEDGRFDDAIAEYDHALQENSELLPALRGKARSLMQLKQYDKALPLFNQAIEQDPEFAPTYANRGILHDRMGRFEEAIKDYEKALELMPELADGPSWITRFLRLQPDKPPTIDDRASYLKEQLALPEEERKLRDPEQDEQQRSYKM
ncbi:tetratricopeptide repeat protein [Thiohalophilus sp.]|uniref:tetratricopeptide repeat protein n=1 Tax=Thiohalophilus sp. TaxID=3028392 RepID=UPI002ACE2668|nr:tetratricopeptide repeat protein [Thiohalophilus sp.]MDZ7662691.1 tetratricopeptide repeat protein [Thiohalophilus sp.]